MTGKRIAIAVEGQTERIFVERYLTHHLVPSRGYSISSQRLRGEGLEQLHLMSNTDAPDFDVLLIDCEGDGKVLSFILERVEGWTALGFSSVTGLRDLFPAAIEQLPILEQTARKLLEPAAIDATILFAVMEMEAWFLADKAHFALIDPRLTSEFIEIHCGIDLDDLVVDADAHPSRTLGEILATVDLQYDKREAEVHRTVSRLDFDYLYVQGRDPVSRLGAFFDRLDVVFS